MATLPMSDCGVLTPGTHARFADVPQSEGTAAPLTQGSLSRRRCSPATGHAI
jgi:hypothetical protein